MNSLDIELRWTPVLAGAGEPYRYPGKLSKYMRRTYDRPAIYCWRVEKPGKPSAMYIGETEHVVRRLRAFLKPGPVLETNLRMQQYLMAAMEDQGDVLLKVLSFPPFVVNGFEVTMERLGNPHVRKLVEHIAVLTEIAQGSVVLNRGKDLKDKVDDRLIRRVPKMRSAEREKFFRMLAAKAGMI